MRYHSEEWRDSWVGHDSQLMIWLMPYKCAMTPHPYWCVPWLLITNDGVCHTTVISHVWTSHVTRTNESCHTYEWVMSHEWMSHVTRINESCHTYISVLTNIWMSPLRHMNESCDTQTKLLRHRCLCMCVCLRSCLTYAKHWYNISIHAYMYTCILVRLHILIRRHTHMCKYRNTKIWSRLQSHHTGYL